MVGETGAVNPVAVCPLCENWQTYLCEGFGMLVREIQPVTLWVEDDFRLRNHDATLGWGGCFCEVHLDLFSQQIGRRVERVELLEAILKPGEPHPWRAKWLELSGHTLLTPLTRLSQAIKSASPETRVALMSSSPDAHSSEGRDWKRFQEAVGNTPTFLSRPNMAPYTQTWALTTPPSLTRLTIANLWGPVAAYPELENSPRCGPYSKSSRYTVWQVMNCAAVGAKGVTINHYDMLGNGLALDRDFGKSLRACKAVMNTLVAEGLDDREADGVEVLFSPRASEFMHTSDAGSLSRLMQESYLWGDTCFILGISHRYTKEITERDSPIVVSGQTLRAFNEEELRRLLKRRVVLDADSVVVLLERGFGDLIGVSGAQWVSLRDSAYSYEEILEGDSSIYGIRNPRMSIQRCSQELLRMEVSKSAQVVTLIRRCDHSPLWPGCVVFNNSLGGTVVSLTYQVARQAQYFMAFFNGFRRIFLQRLFFTLSPRAPLAMAAAHPLHCYRTSFPDGVRLNVFNPTDDTTDSVVIDLPSGEIKGGSWTSLDSNGTWVAVEPQVERATLCDRFSFPVNLGFLDGLFLKWVRA